MIKKKVLSEDTIQSPNTISVKCYSFLFNLFVFFFIYRSELANHLKSQCYSLVIGFNLLGSLVMSAIMTFFFVQFNFLEITVPGRVS